MEALCLPETIHVPEVVDSTPLGPWTYHQAVSQLPTPQTCRLEALSRPQFHFFRRRLR